MPPRIFTLVIVAFWLAMAALFSVTEIWPRLSPAEPLMFPVDVVDEAGQSRDLVNYYVSKNGVLNYRADVELSYHPEDDSFESECQLEKSFFDVKEAKRDQGPALLPQVHEVKMTSVYRLTRDAEMRRIDVRTKYVLAVGNDDENAYKVEAHITGTPQARQFVPHLKLTFPDLKPDAQIGPFTPRDFQQDADPVAVLPRGTVLNPLHPPRRFTDLAEGQRLALHLHRPARSPGTWLRLSMQPTAARCAMQGSGPASPSSTPRCSPACADHDVGRRQGRVVPDHPAAKATAPSDR